MPATASWFRFKRLAAALVVATLALLGPLARAAHAADMSAHGTHVMTLADGAMAHAFRAMTPGPAGPVEAPPELKKVLSGVLCQCGCNLSVYDCEATMTCDVAKKMRADAERLLAQGMTSEQALGVFATNYGEDVLAAPTKEGFNLTAWVLPFAALAIGLVAVGVALRTWVPRRRTADGPEEETPPVDQRFVDAIERELGEED